MNMQVMMLASTLALVGAGTVQWTQYSTSDCTGKATSRQHASYQCLDFGGWSNMVKCSDDLETVTYVQFGCDNCACAPAFTNEGTSGSCHEYTSGAYSIVACLDKNAALVSKAHVGCADIGAYYEDASTGYKAEFFVNSGFLGGDGCHFFGMDTLKQAVWGTVDGNTVAMSQSDGSSYSGILTNAGDLAWNSGSTWKRQVTSQSKTRGCSNIEADYKDESTGYKAEFHVSSGFLGGDGCHFFGMDTLNQTVWGTVDGNTVTMSQSDASSYSGILTNAGDLAWNTGSPWKRQSVALVV
jgi:hypothetical protein